jgi:hypothetical protein
MKHRPNNDFAAQISSFERNRETKVRLKKIKSPDTSKLIALSVPYLRATFYFKSKAKMRKKIAQLNVAGLEYVIN